MQGSEARGFAIPWRLKPTVLQSHSSVLPTQTPRASSNTPGGRQHILHSSCTHYWTLSNKTPEESSALSLQQQEPVGAGLSLQVAGERLEEQVKWTSQRKRIRPFLLWSTRNSLMKVLLSSSSHSPLPKAANPLWIYKNLWLPPLIWLPNYSVLILHGTQHSSINHNLGPWSKMELGDYRECAGKGRWTVISCARGLPNWIGIMNVGVAGDVLRERKMLKWCL